MANISVTYSFTNGTALDATQVNTNFSDIIAGTSDGTKDFSINALAVAAAATFNGNVTLGNASSDDLTVTGSLASSIPIKTTRSYDIGSADLGLRVIYLGMNSTHTIALQAPSAGASADYTIELPATAGSVGQGLVRTSTSAVSWAPQQYTTNSVSSADYTVTDTDGYYLIDVTTGSSDRTVTLPTLADNTGRVIMIAKADSGTGFVIVDGENSETINGDATKTLRRQYDLITVKALASEWRVVKQELSDAVISSWASYTPTTNGFGGLASVNVWWRRVGTSVEVQGYFTSGTLSAASEAQIGLPNSYTVGGVGSSPFIVGKIDTDASASDNNHNLIATAGDAFVNVARHNMQSTATNMLLPVNINAIWSVNAQRISIWFSVPIAELQTF